MNRRRVRTREPSRNQSSFRFDLPDDWIAQDHRARLLWQVIGLLDLSAFTANSMSLEGVAGRPVSSVQMLLTLWMYAVSEGVGSARAIARKIDSDDAYRWIAGGESVSHSKLSEFRVGHRVALDKLLTDVLASLLQQGLLSLDLVAQDGIRVRAHASAPSFRSASGLSKLREQAALHVKAVFAEADDPEASEREKRARERGALDIQRRVEAAIQTVNELQTEDKEAPRASTTDADARVMKMADGGFRPAYNVQLATAGDPMGGPRTIVGVRVTNVGSDMGSICPMLDDIERRTGSLPKVLLADGGHAKHECIRAAAERGVQTLVPPISPQIKPTDADRDPAIAAWKAHMQTDEAKQAYRARASLCELSNAHFKEHHGIAQVLVRSLEKVTCIALFGALTANLLAHASSMLG
jgi:transposase